MLKLTKDFTKLYIILVGMIVVFKLFLMGIFSSDYEQMMFMPFVQSFLDGNNPYDYFYQNHLISSFPYPPLMLLIESIFGGISAKISSVYLSRLVFKIPLLVFDLLCLYFLEKMCGKRKKYLLILYFCSPIILFSTYMHGQLDIIPTSFLVISLFYLTQNSKVYDTHISAVLLGCALASKLHILAVVPILFLYLTKKSGVKKSVIYVCESFITLALFVIPFWCDGFINTVLKNKEQSMIVNLSLDYGSVQLLLVVLIVCVIYLKVFQVNNINRELLLSVIGVMFSVFLMCIAPMPGWFVWIVPFVFIYFTYVYDNKYKMLAIYSVFNLIYLIYFVFIHQTGYVTLYIGKYSLETLKLSADLLNDIVFTLMTATLLMIIWNMYQYGMAENSLYKRSSTPFTIGISGDSGTGKSELLEKIEDALGVKRILHIEGDGDHRWERGSSDWEQKTHLDPRANFLYRQAEDISILRAGSRVCRVDYDHNTGKFTEKKRIKPKPYIILCGLHSLFLPKSRQALDLKIYMDTDEKLRRLWKIKRDTTTRGYSKEKIVEQIEKRIPDAKKYIYPQKQYADLIISYFDPTLQNCMDIYHEIVMCLRLTMNIAINTEELIEKLKIYGANISLEYSEDITKQILTIDISQCVIKNEDLAHIANEVVSNYNELFETNIKWRNGMDGILQLILLKMISETMKGTS